MCSPKGIELVHVQREYPEVRADSCEDVVRASLKQISKDFSEPFIIEDSGLFIDALNGFPGVYSAMVFKKIGLNGILKLLDGVENRKATFVSVVGYFDGKTTQIFTGRMEGEVADKIRGESGFGYDPLVIPKGYKFTFSEDMSLKHRLSHRRMAIEKLIKYVNGDD